MIDYLLQFPDEATAKADSVVGAYAPKGVWRTDICTVGMQFWDNVNDTIVNITAPNGSLVPTTQHVFFTGFWLLISLPTHDAQLDSSPARQLVVDYTKLQAATTNAQIAGSVIFSTLTALQLKTKRFQPWFAGRSYSF